MLYYLYFFFFSSRRRHTRSLCDWSSDVCSSDLPGDSWMPFLRPIRPSDNRNTTSKIRRLEIEHSLQFDLKWGLLTKGQATNIPAEPRYSSTDLLLENAMARQADRGLPVDRFAVHHHSVRSLQEGRTEQVFFGPIRESRLAR